MAVRTITREDYRWLRLADHAGTVRKLEPETVQRWREANPDWDGKYWGLYSSGTTLGPINVRS
ncbi:hypothetical protein IU443_28240 [Nocardia farcinica]|uniref:Uncharacterized protein n=1 Tax=Nocardia farcinica TaxID=37329 RepID=A0A449HDY3_NOCFR|nr:hypothetical protein [Nocardia farcinica]MBF6393822.1 hypothetical protein [Nocardia farcinica]MBF6411282.1 hypothetical protein [Nocardia farcinica]MCZ9330257.1 hypothetical protein [Nocardia farcinica]UEX26180.1 hypothetical protein LMJ57_30325 [Nocardia farcinica]VFA96206.1 Uncharacterised protein [Nocardia farcinica]